MSDTEVTRANAEARSRSSSFTMAEAVGGVGVIVLTILGLADVRPVFLVAIAVVVTGLITLAQGSQIAGEYVRLLRDRGESSLMGGSVSFSVELLAGIGGIVLGILALLQVVPETLAAVAVIAYGGALVLSSGAAANIAMWRLESPGADERMQQLVNETVSTTTVVQSVMGLVAVVLGILALAGFNSVALILVALLLVGSYFLLSSSAFGSLASIAFRS